MNERLMLRAALIVSKHLSRSEHFKEFVRKFHSNPLPTQVEEILKAEIDGYSQNNALPESMVELREALFARNGHDPNVLVENYLSHLRANQSSELRELLSQIQMELDFVLDAPISAASDAEQHLFSEFPEPFWNTENLTNTDLRTEIRQAVTRFFEELDESDQILTEQLDEVAPLLEQLRNLDDEQLRNLDEANVSSESGISGAISPEAAQAISEIVDAASNISDKEGELEDVLMDNLEKIIEFNLDPVDVIAALDEKIIHGDPSTLEASFDPQAADNCVIALSKVVASQFGIHIPEGALTLRTILDGTLKYDISLYSKCLTKLRILCLQELELSVEGTETFQLTQTLHRLGVPVDIDYDATLDEIAAQLSQDKAVMVVLNVEPIWHGSEGRHVVLVVSIDKENGTVTTLDTGTKDTLGNPDGNHKVYNLENFEEARELGGSIMISTKKARPIIVREQEAEGDEESSNPWNEVPSPEDEAGAIERVTPVVRVVPDPVPEQEVLSAKEYDDGGKPPQKVSPDDDSSKSETPEDQAFGTDHESDNTVNIPGLSDTSNEEELEVETGSS